MRTLRIGMMGAGMISHTHHEAFQQVPGTEVVAVSSHNEERGRRFCELHGIPDFHADPVEMFKRRDIDIITIGTPNFLHARQTIQAASHGKHVICEKPLALTLEEADQMIEACDKAGVILGYAEELCFIPKFVHAKQRNTPVRTRLGSGRRTRPAEAR